MATLAQPNPEGRAGKKAPEREYFRMGISRELYRRAKVEAAKRGCIVGDVVARLIEEHLPPIEDDRAA